MATITPTTASRCFASSRSCPSSKSPMISNMKGPASALPLCPAELAGGRSQLLPVQIVPSGAIVTCWAMSLHPFSCV